MKRVAVISTASGNGKTAEAADLAARLDLPSYELDALHHGPNWAEPPLEEFGRGSKRSFVPRHG